MPTSSTSTTRFHSCEKRIKVEDRSLWHDEVHHSDAVRLKEGKEEEKEKEKKDSKILLGAARIAMMVAQPR